MAVSRENLPRSSPMGTDIHDLKELLKHRAELDATLPPTPVRELLAASGATLFVLAIDAGLVATIRRAAEQHPLFVVETWADLMEAVQSRRCGIALLDATLLGSRVTQCVAELAAHADHVVTLVAADRGAAQDYVGPLSDGRIHRLLIKPVAVGAARLLIDSATARCFQLREEHANDAARGSAAPASRRFPKWAGAAAAGTAVLAVVGTALLGSRLGWWTPSTDFEEAAMTAVVAAAPAAASTVAERIAEYHGSAARARVEGRLAEPVGDNALDHYLAILALAPTDQTARDGLSSVVDTLFTLAEEALLASSLEEAATALDHVRRAGPASSRLAFLDAQLARALTALAAPAAAAEAANAAAPSLAQAPTELDSTLNLAAARLRRGQLLTPAGDSARAYLDRAMELAPADPRVAALRADLAAAVVAAARLVSAADAAAAANLVTQARQLGAEAAALAALERDVNAARARQAQDLLGERLAAAAERVRAGALAPPSFDSALGHLARLQTDAPGLPGLAELWQEFRQAAVTAVEVATEGDEWAAAEALLAGLTQAPGGAEAAAPLASELTARRLQAEYLATPGRATELELVGSAPVVYPPDALERAVEGWVDLDFVVDRNGQPQNVAVTQSAPPGRFDAAARAAVEQYRYVPFERDGRVYERRVRLRVRFDIQ